MQSGSAELLRISRALREAGNGAAMRHVAGAMRDAARPLPLYTARAALEQLPHRGGLARRVADERVSVSVRTGANTAGVSLVMRHHDAAVTDLGYVRHPTFGHAPWRTESIPRARGWWSDTLAQHSDEITPYIWRAMQQVAAAIQRGI
jgi:hypothetical protein